MKWRPASATTTQRMAALRPFSSEQTDEKCVRTVTHSRVAHTFLTCEMYGLPLLAFYSDAWRVRQRMRSLLIAIKNLFSPQAAERVDRLRPAGRLGWEHVLQGPY